MDDKEMRRQAEKYAKQVAEILDNMGKEMEKAANTIGKMGEQAYDAMPPKARAVTKDMRSVFDSVADNLRQDIPKLQKNIEHMARRMGEYADDIQKTMKGGKK